MGRPSRKQLSTTLHLSTQEEWILTLISGRELYAPHISRALNEVCGGSRTGKPLYPMLSVLVKRKLIAARWADDTPEEPRGPRRRYLKTTTLDYKHFKRPMAVGRA